MASHPGPQAQLFIPPNAGPQEIIQHLQRAIQASQGSGTRRSQSGVNYQTTAFPSAGTVNAAQTVVNTGQSGSAVLLQALSPGSTILSSLPTTQRNRNPTSTHTNPVFSYKVKVINPAKKSEMIVRQINNFSVKFGLVTALRVKLMEEFKEQVPATVDYNVGYCDGNQGKVWLVTQEDLTTMYLKYKNGGTITLWCDARIAEKGEETLCKRTRDSARSDRRQEKEEEVESAYKQLLEKHGKKFDTPKLRLWSRMISSGLHDDYDSPPDIPAFSGMKIKKPRRDPLTEALTGAAVTLAQSFSSSKDKNEPSQQSPSAPTASAIGISPAKAVELRMKNLEQLRYLQRLFDDGIVSEREFTDLKRGILTSLQKL